MVSFSPVHRPPWGLSRKESTYHCGRGRLDFWVGKIPWGRKWQPTLVFLPRKFHAQRSLEGYSPGVAKEFRHNLVNKNKNLIEHACLFPFYRRENRLRVNIEITQEHESCSKWESLWMFLKRVELSTWDDELSWLITPHPAQGGLGSTERFWQEVGRQASINSSGEEEIQELDDT